MDGAIFGRSDAHSISQGTFVGHRMRCFQGSSGFQVANLYLIIYIYIIILLCIFYYFYFIFSNLFNLYSIEILLYIYSIYMLSIYSVKLPWLLGTEFEAQAAAPEEKRQRVSFSSVVLKVEDVHAVHAVQQPKHSHHIHTTFTPHSHSLQSL